jgi:long-chain acyl-CoA synthetase
MLVDDFVRDSVRLTPNKEALVCGDRRLTYAELEWESNRLSNYLLSRGVARGDRVCIYLDNCVEAVISILGILKAGAVFSVINGSTKANRLSFILNSLRASALISHQRKAEVLAQALPESPTLKVTLLAGADAAALADLGAVSLTEALAPEPTTRPRQIGIDLDLAAIITTSGSTGVPKGAMITHRSMTATADSIAEYLANDSNDITLCVLPLSHCYGLYQVIVGLRVGATVVLEDGFAFPYRIVQLLQRERITGFAGVPTVYSVLLQIKSLGSLEFPHLRYLTNAAAGLPLSHIDRLRVVFPRAKIYCMYGQTECTRVCYLPPEELDGHPGSVGIAIPNTEVFVVDANGRPVGPNVVGELVVRGPHLMAGYWEAPAETARALGPGPVPGERVLHTGDLFRTDESGFLYFVARSDDIIKCRGEKVSPLEIENALYAMEAISEAAVIGVPDDTLGQAIWAFVAVRDGAKLTERDVLAHCARCLEDYLVPKRVEIMPSLPKTPSGKITKAALREVAGCVA